MYNMHESQNNCCVKANEITYCLTISFYVESEKLKIICSDREQTKWPLEAEEGNAKAGATFAEEMNIFHYLFVLMMVWLQICTCLKTP